MAYARTIPVEFNHCDPAGIVFYPRYFEMVNSVVENFFAEAIEYPFARMMREQLGVPTARIEANFRAPSRLGDRVDFTLQVRRVGGSSVTLLLSGRAGGELRLTVDLTLVWLSAGRATAWPDAIRKRLMTHLEATS